MSPTAKFLTVFYKVNCIRQVSIGVVARDSGKGKALLSKEEGVEMKYTKL